MAVHRWRWWISLRSLELMCRPPAMNSAWGATPEHEVRHRRLIQPIRRPSRRNKRLATAHNPAETLHRALSNFCRQCGKRSTAASSLLPTTPPTVFAAGHSASSITRSPSPSGGRAPPRDNLTTGTNFGFPRCTSELFLAQPSPLP